MNLSATEILVICVVALVVLGPARLPEAARTVGKGLRELRKISTGFQDEMRHALEDAEEDAAEERARKGQVGPTIQPYRPAPGSPAARAKAAREANEAMAARQAEAASDAAEPAAPDPGAPDPGAVTGAPPPAREPASNGSDGATDHPDRDEAAGRPAPG